MQIRLFAGYGFDESLLTQADGIERAYATGVTMGGNLGPYEATEGEQSIEPGFLVMASADTQSAPLQRLQIVKGWVDADGTHEEVVDVAVRAVLQLTQKQTVALTMVQRSMSANCSSTKKPGAQLSALWRDPDFKADERAFYYARAIENPTCRWSTWDANRAGVAPRPDLPATIQERAWSSPIHYVSE